MLYPVREGQSGCLWCGVSQRRLGPKLWETAGASAARLTGGKVVDRVFLLRFLCLLLFPSASTEEICHAPTAPCHNFSAVQPQMQQLEFPTINQPECEDAMICRRISIHLSLFCAIAGSLCPAF